MRPQKQTPTPTELRRMLAKHSGEHGEKCLAYGAVLILIIMSITMSGWLWAISGLLMGFVAPVAGIILAFVAAKSLFHFVIERLPGADGAGR